MTKIRVSLKERSYDVVTGSGVVRQLPVLLKKILKSKNVLLVTSSNLNRLYGRKILSLLKKSGFKTALHLSPEGESAKFEKELFNIYRSALNAELDRSSGIIALGGGAIGDVAAFAASTYLRGVAFVNIPTTLLAQVDSAIGGKTAINLKEGKNLIGTFYQPRLVISDAELLKTLPEREFRSSLAEVVKYGVIASSIFFKFLEANIEKISKRDPKVLARIILECARIKARVVEKDEREETGLRAILNFGHTFAHAYEKAAGFRKLLHGEAVAMGMCEAARLSENKNFLKPSQRERVEKLIALLGLPTSAARFQFKTSEILKTIKRDKKKKGERINFILVDRIGHAFCSPLIPKSTYL